MHTVRIARKASYLDCCVISCCAEISKFEFFILVSQSIDVNWPLNNVSELMGLIVKKAVFV